MENEDEEPLYPWSSDDPDQIFGGQGFGATTPAGAGEMQVDTGGTKRSTPGDGGRLDGEDLQQVKANKRATKTFMAKVCALEQSA